MLDPLSLSWDIRAYENKLGRVKLAVRDINDNQTEEKAFLARCRFCHARSRISLVLVRITRDLYASVNNYDLSFLLGGVGGTPDYLLSVIFI